LNFGNYKNGRLIKKKDAGGKGGGKGGGGKGGGGKGGGKGKGRGGGGGATNSRAAALMSTPKAGGPKIKGQPMSFWEHEFVCATCRISISGEIALAQHCQGKAHLSATGYRGFSGLLPNEAGIIPKVSGICIEACNGDAGSKGGDAVAGSVGLTGAAHSVIKDALAQNTIIPDDKDGDSVTNGSGANRNQPRRRGRNSVPDLRPPPKINHKDEMGPMGDQRRGLPVFDFREQLLETIDANHVTVVEGETGSGKTTQVPQYCLEDAANRGVPCNIIIAQPRRISAMSVAERVAAERGDPLGQTVGYTIRLESKATQNTRLLFCTTGILLKRLEEDETLANVTHVFVDEVHERSIESDFLLMVLRDLIPKRTSGSPLKVVLMSATLDASLFHDYFWGAPNVKFPGRTYPVTELYLEDALEVTGHIVRGNEDWCRKGGSGGGGGGGGKGKGGGGGKGKGGGGGGGARTFDDPRLYALADRDDEYLDQMELSSRYSYYSPNVQQALMKLDHNAINYGLVVETIAWLSSLPSPQHAAAYLNGGRPQQAHDPDQDTTSSAILVFLPVTKPPFYIFIRYKTSPSIFHPL
jgi:hypothetical protein